MLVQVAIENTAYSFDKLFTYSAPAELNIQPGCRVMVPFGGGNRTRVAMVMRTNAEYDGDSQKLKQVLSVLDPEPLLSDEMISLVFWMKNKYFCTFFDAVRLMIPIGAGYKLNYLYELNGDAVIDTENMSDVQRQIISCLARKALNSDSLRKALGINEDAPSLKSLVKDGFVLRTDSAQRKIGDASAKMIRPSDADGVELTSRQQSVYDVLCDVGSVSVKELTYFTGASASIIKGLVQKGAAVIFDAEIYRRPAFSDISAYDDEETDLSPKQSEIFDKLVDEYERKDSVVSLLYGVTGSGKTSVFLKFIDYVVGKDKEVILMVPEISLTPQTIAVFRKKFGDNIAVFHSGLSIGERLDEWKRAARGEAKIVIGTRSAVFAPFKNLGLIVIDEEQEHTYKSETSPRYHAREIAKFRINYNKSFCLLSSATPSLESYYLAQKGQYSFYALTERYGSATIPEVRLIDMSSEAAFGNQTDISFAMKKALNDNLRAGMQSIVLLNRRGYHTFVRCSSCHAVMTCPNCSISLTYHSANNRLMCHYCGFSKEFTSKCPSCGKESVAYSGYGTQRAEEAIAEAVPGARILRIDADSVSAKYSLERKLDLFSAGEYDIMVGTQMVAKGLNFENVTLVGVVSADQSLYSDDFRSNERTFDLLTQVIGRAGRGKHPGKAYIQTEIPENPYLRLAANQDYVSFYEMETEFRRAMLYPPYVDILVVGFVGEKENKVREASDFFLNMFSVMAKKEYSELPLRVLRASPAAVARISNKYRYKIIVKCKNTIRLRELVSRALINFSSKKDFSDVTAFADTNPDSIL